MEATPPSRLAELPVLGMLGRRQREPHARPPGLSERQRPSWGAACPLDNSFLCRVRLLFWCASLAAETGTILGIRAVAERRIHSDTKEGLTEGAMSVSPFKDGILRGKVGAFWAQCAWPEVKGACFALLQWG